MINLIFLFITPFVNGDRIVQTNSGPIRGITLDTQNVEAFLGIPYAEPPVGNLRFGKPTPKASWTGIFDAKELPPSCVQGMIETLSKFYNQSEEIDEDCLYLNLWVPKNGTTSKPIMIFIHGGGYMTGSSNIKIYDGTALSNYGDVIVASMNYRVGSLGFFSAFIDEAAGNMGMYDQILAIQWIKDNAKYFGGDPDSIVIFGESAGAYSVSLHMVSPLSKNLFNRAILQSGAAFSPVFSDDNHVLRQGSQTISTLVGCAENGEELEKNPKTVVECMKNISAEKFAEADDVLLKNLSSLIPRVGDQFLPTNPIDLFRKGEFKDTEVLLGVTRDECSFFVVFQVGYENGDMFGNTIDINAFNETTVSKILQPFTQNEQLKKIVQQYLKRVKVVSGYTYLHALSDFIGDAQITCPTLFQADFQSMKSHPVYFYLFNYRSPSSIFPKWMGVTHFEEVQYVFGNPMMKIFSENEEKLSKSMMDMWVTFAKTGNPRIPRGLKWPKYTYDDPKYLIINMTNKVDVKPDNYRCEAWRRLYRATIEEKVIEKVKNSI